MRWIAHIEGCPKRVNHAAVAVNHKIYSFGGYSTGEDCRGYSSMDVHVLNTRTNRWFRHPVSDLPYFENDDILPYRRYGHTAVEYKGNVYVWGGRNDRAPCSVLFKFDTFWHCWMAPPTTGSAPMARDGHSACIWKNYMFLLGGYEDETDTFAKMVFYLDLERLHWSYAICDGYIPQDEETEPTLRDFHTTVCIKDRIYLFGGRGAIMSIGPPQETYCNKMWYLDLKNFNWHLCKVTGDIPSGRRSSSSFVHNGKMYIFGGYNAVESRHYNDLYMFDPDTNVWTLIKPHGKSPCERRRQACAKVGDKVYIFGGTSPRGKQTDDQTETSLDDLVDHSDMFILDLSPSLKTLCLIAVKQYNLDTSELPWNLREDLHNLRAPNKITLSRPNNSAG